VYRYQRGSRGRFLTTQQASKLLNRWGLKERDQRKLSAHSLLYLGKEAYGNQRVSSQIEKVVLHTNRLDTQDLLPYLDQSTFQFISRRHKDLVRVGPSDVWLGQSPPIYLAIGRQWQGIKSRKCGGHHIAGQLLLKKALQFPNHRGFALVGDDIGDQLVVATSVCTDGDGCLENGRVLGQGGFDFAQLDAVAANLDLAIDTSTKLDSAIWPVSTQVPRSIEAIGTRA
jgi:hypothetical protein